MEYTAASRPLVPGIRHIDFNNISDLERITRHTAAVICEPVQGEAGVILPETGYLEALRQRCNETGTLLILDEIQTGMGRTGSLFAFLQENVIPDILLAGKAFGAGMPLAAFTSSKQIMQVLAENPMLGHITTFGGHPLSCAASLAALTWLEEEPIMEDVSAYGDLCRKTISAHPAVKEVRGKGHMMAVELHHPEKKLNVLAACRKEGLLLDWFLFNDTSIRFYPPLITTRDEMQMILHKWLTGLEEGR
jgi:acetylornithine/succinyldiaminopimelate/putrescine aminotransferase